MDIVVTIPKHEYTNDDRETKDFLETEGSCQFWVFKSRKPAKLAVGDRVHFVKNGRVESSMKVIEIRENVVQVCNTTGRSWGGRCIVFMNDLQYHETIIESKGFQGFRYKWWGDNDDID